MDDQNEYAVTGSEDESFKPADSEQDEAEEEATDDEVCIKGDDGEETRMLPEDGEAALNASSGDEALVSRSKPIGKATCKTAELLSIECVNVTSMDTQLDALLSSKASVVFIQEHKVRRNEVKKFRKQIREAGWRMHLSPCDESGKKAAAGVGVIWREGDVQIFHEKLRGGAIAEAHALGRVAKYVMDVGWERAYTCYVVYGYSGGSRETEAATEALMCL